MVKTEEIRSKQSARPDDCPAKTEKEKLSKGSPKNEKYSDSDLCTAISNLKVDDASCVSYKTKYQSTVVIDDRKQKRGNVDNFHDN